MWGKGERCGEPRVGRGGKVVVPRLGRLCLGVKALGDEVCDVVGDGLLGL